MIVAKPQSWTAGEFLQLIRDDPEISRSELARRTGLSPSTVANRIEPLLQLGYVTEKGEPNKGGRKPRPLALNSEWGVVLTAHIGSRHTRVGVIDMVGNILSVREFGVAAPDSNVDEYLEWLESQFLEALESVDLPGGGFNSLRGIGMSIPAPVDISSGELVGPRNFPTWNRALVIPRFADRFRVPVALDNDVTLMALGEHRMHRPDVQNMIYVKLGSAIGCGLVVNGATYRGTSGGAGEVAHMRVETDYPRRCFCGKDNCLEACFGGTGLIEHLRDRGHDVSTTADVIALAEQGDPEALELARAAGIALGESLGVLAEFLSPAQIVLGGRLSELGALTMALKVGVFSQSHPIAVSALTIETSTNGAQASVLGAAWYILDLVLSEDAVNRAVAEIETSRTA